MSNRENLLQEKLSKFQDKLLDLSKRNKMIKSNFQSRAKTHFRVIDEIPDILYKKLLEGNMEFKPLPPIDKNPKDENTPEFKEKLALMEKENEEYINEMEKIEREQTDNLNEAKEKALRMLKNKVRIELNLPPISTKHTPLEEHCKKSGFNPNYDLPNLDESSTINNKWNDSKIQTLMLPDTLKNYLNSIHKKYCFSLREIGINPLFFCFGFLEWTESENSNLKLYAPILTFQVSFKDVKNGRYIVTGMGSEININQALAEKLKRDFKFEMPKLEESDSDNDFLIKKYLEKIKKLIRDSNYEWEVKNWVSFGLYNTQSMIIYKDISRIKDQDTNSKLEKILLGNNSDLKECEKYDIDNREIEKHVPVLIESADASQYSAIIDALKGKDFVIQGPPGTGKSQTITNIIMELISRRKKVLFVAQKQAALDVVRNKLQANRLGDYILEVFSAKANKKIIMESMKKRINSKPDNNSKTQYLEKKIKEFWDIKRQLNEYSKFISSEFNDTEFTVHDVIWNHKFEENTKYFEIKDGENFSKDTIKNNLASLQEIKNLYPQNIHTLKDNLFLKIKILPDKYDDLKCIKKKISDFYNKTTVLLEKKKEIFKTNNSLINLDTEFFNHFLIKKYFSLSTDSRKEDYVNLLHIIFKSRLESLKIYINQKREYYDIKSKNEKDREEIYSLFKMDYLPNLSKLQREKFILKNVNDVSFVFSKTWQEAKMFFQAICKKENLSSIEEIRCVLNNEQKIFSKKHNRILTQDIVRYSESNNLKEYVQKKEEYIKISKEMDQERENIKSIFKLEIISEQTPIERITKIFQEEHIFSIFSPEYWQAMRVFKQIRTGKKVRYSKYNILEQLWKYLKSRSVKEQNLIELKKEIDNIQESLQKICTKQELTLHNALEKLIYYLNNHIEGKIKEEEIKNKMENLQNTICSQIKTLPLNDVLDKEKDEIIFQMMEHSKSLDVKFKENWLNHPISLIHYRDLKHEEECLLKNVNDFIKDLGVEYFDGSLKWANDFFSTINQSNLNLDIYRNMLRIIKGMNQSMHSFYISFIDSGENIQKIEEIYKKSIYKAQQKIVERIFSNQLSLYTPRQLKNLKETLHRLDKEISDLHTQKIINKVHEFGESVPDGEDLTGKVKDKTEMKLVYHISNKNKPRISLRDYFSRAFDSITCLKPCTLMSPLSVSQVLPQNIKYDVMIIDEASQMKPEFSIPSIARADQIIIVGDQKQLPPTDFFQSISEEENDEDESEESILGIASTVLYPSRKLLWHYRSKHEKLIKFSNHKFYDDELIIPNTPDINNQNKGVKRIKVNNGVYHSRSAGHGRGGFNKPEADKVIQEVIKFMQERPEKSLGVATINKAQRDLIENLFEIEKSKGNPAIHDYINDWSQKDEGLNEFFIKNLEDIQGDERDVIFISTVYGPDEKSGKVFQRFGPITGQHGHRRLNVLFTRAKDQIVLFTSLESSDIQVSENKSEGVKILKDYLSFAETGKLPLSNNNIQDVESPFQQWAIDQINSFPGFSADWEIGEKGYRIDIGVKHENYPSRLHYGS